MTVKLDTKSFGRLAKGDRLVPFLEKEIAKGDFPWTFDYVPKEGDDAWHPSSDCTPTTRRLYDKATGNAPDDHIRGGLRKAFIVGHFWHQYIQDILVRRLEFATPDAIERRASRSWSGGDLHLPYRWVTGSADVAPLSLPDGKEYLLDIKTMNAHDFRGAQAPVRYVDKWECQTNIYMDFFDLDQAIILGVMKDSPHDFREFLFDRNQELVDTIYSKWKLVGKCMDEGIEPPEDDGIDLPLRGPS
jgi:hypothetical protein